MSNIPADLKYAKSHEWVRVTGDIATVGISDHAQHELTDVVFVELPQPGRKIKAGESFGTAYIVGWFDDIAEMEKIYDQYKGARSLTVADGKYRLE